MRAALEHDADSNKQKYTERSLSQLYLIHHKPRLNEPGIEPEFPR